jgi:integrase
MAVARAASDEQQSALYIVAAFTGLREGELRALRWRDVDWSTTVHVRRNIPAHGQEKVPKSKVVRSVPLIDVAARALVELSRRSTTRPGRPRLRRRTRSAARRQGAAPGLLRGARASGPRAHAPRATPAALSRSAPYVRHVGRARLGPAQGAGLHGPLKRADHDEIRASRAQDERRRRAQRPGGGCATAVRQRRDYRRLARRPRRVVADTRRRGQRPPRATDPQLTCPDVDRVGRRS